MDGILTSADGHAQRYRGDGGVSSGRLKRLGNTVQNTDRIQETSRSPENQEHVHTLEF